MRQPLLSALFVPHEMTHYVVAWWYSLGPRYHFWEQRVSTSVALTPENARLHSRMNLAPFLLLPVSVVAGALAFVGLGATWSSIVFFAGLFLSLPSRDDIVAARQLRCITGATVVNTEACWVCERDQRVTYENDVGRASYCPFCDYLLDESGDVVLAGQPEFRET